MGAGGRDKIETIQSHYYTIKPRGASKIINGDVR